MPVWVPPPGDIARVVALAKKAGGDDAQLVENHLFWGLFNRKSGLFGDSAGIKSEWLRSIRFTRRMRRRQWIERFFTIRQENGTLGPLILNPAQRRLECQVLRMERARVPVRLQICKARKQGFSTLIQAYMFERSMREQHFEGLIVANNKDLAEKLVRIAEIARKQMRKEGEARWDFSMKSTARSGLMWGDPFDSVLRITSAEVDEPARGGTPSMIHGTETAFWKDAERKQPAVFSSLPALPGTYAFDESTANGQANQFCNDFWKAWANREVPFHERENPWNAVFFGWWEHPSYRYSLSYGAGQQSQKMPTTIRDPEERWLLTQKYLRRWSPDDEWEQVEFHEVEEIDIDRNGNIVGTYKVKRSGKKWRRKGVGWRNVDHDQLAWRRTKIQDKDCGGDINKFNQEYPSRPEVAFTSSGSPLFDGAVIDQKLADARARKPIFIGSMSAPGSTFRSIEAVLDDGDAATEDPA